MKITRLCVPVLLVLAACSPAPQEEEAVSARPTREENVARYLAKAKQNGRLAQERRRPIKAPAPVNVAEIKTHPDEMFFPALPAEMAAVKANLERRVRQEYGENGRRTGRRHHYGVSRSGASRGQKSAQPGRNGRRPKRAGPTI